MLPSCQLGSSHRCRVSQECVHQLSLSFETQVHRARCWRGLLHQASSSLKCGADLENLGPSIQESHRVLDLHLQQQSVPHRGGSELTWLAGSFCLLGSSRSQWQRQRSSLAFGQLCRSWALLINSHLSTSPCTAGFARQA